MAGSLVLVDEFTISSAVSSVIIGGGSSGSSSYNFAIDSTYNVYKLVQNNVTGVGDDTTLRFRFTVSGTPDSSSNYDKAVEKLRADTGFNQSSNENYNYGRLSASGTGTGTGEVTNSTYYLFNFPNSSEYSFITGEEVMLSYSPKLFGSQGGLVLTVAQATDGIQFYMDSGNIASGEFRLYGLKK